MISSIFDYDFSEKGIDILVVFGTIKIAHLPRENIRAVSAETLGSVFKHMLFHMFRVLGLTNRWTSRYLVVETTFNFAKYWYLTPLDPERAIDALDLS